jgi:hypothetical protein
MLQINKLKRPVRSFLRILGILLMLFAMMPAAYVNAISQSDLDSITGNYPFYDPNDAGGVCSQSSTVLAGNDNEQIAYNFFVSKGLQPYQAAAIVGNLMSESGVNPSSGAPPTDSTGFGIAQWTFTPRQAPLEELAKSEGKPVTDLGLQLEYMWDELTGTAPANHEAGLSELKAASNVDDAASAFMGWSSTGGAPGYENPLYPADPDTGAPARQKNAEDILAKYGSSPTGLNNQNASGSTTSSCLPGSTLSPDCQTASGVAKIICAAKQYDTVSYSETIEGGHQGAVAWHNDCPTIGPSCVLDCSGLVNIAVYDVFGSDLRENTYLEASDTQNWKHIPFGQVQPGDLIQPNPGHVEIIDHVQGSTIYTFGAHSSHYPQPRQVGPAQFTNSSGNVYLHYVGQGSPSQ